MKNHPTFFPFSSGDLNEPLNELIKGQERMSPSPDLADQFLLDALGDAFGAHLKTQNLAGRMARSPTDVILEAGKNRLQPDLVYVAPENRHLFQDCIRGVPDLVLEVVSAASVLLDTQTKFRLYEHYQVPEYWLVFPEYRKVAVYAFEKGGYELFSEATNEGEVASRGLPGMQLEVKGLFRVLD